MLSGPRAETSAQPSLSLPDVPALEGYTIDAPRTDQLARLIRFDELQATQVAHLIRVLTRRHA